MIGVLHIVERETHNIVTIDFHDQSSQASDHFDDYTKYDMGALGTGGAVYASSPASKLESSSVKYRPFQTWNSISAEWTIDLPVGETVTALAVGGGNNSASAEDDMLDGERLDEIAGSGTVVVATNRRFLRFLSGSGMQKYLMNFGEEIVTMTGGKEMLLIVHRAHEIVKPGMYLLSR
jgi:chromosome transmission fidelity protein 4